jgi:hypothetical protein
MNHNNSKPHTISPFLEGVARTFDLAGYFDDSDAPESHCPNPISEDWKTIGSDYYNSVKIIGEDLNGNKNKTAAK